MENSMLKKERDVVFNMDDTIAPAPDKNSFLSTLNT